MEKGHSISKRLRFEIFKRDGFTCQYCGQQPPDGVLEIDHIRPLSKGGETEPLNLVTSCFDCNRGKADRELGKVRPRPDADLEWLATQQEIAELRRYQEGRAARDKLTKEIIALLQESWGVHWRTKEIPDEAELAGWLSFASPDLIEEAIIIASRKWRSIGGYDRQLRYTAGVMHKLGRQQEE